MCVEVRPYLPEFLQLPFHAEAGAAGLQQALASASVYLGLTVADREHKRP
jgi:hypothetical protein